MGTVTFAARITASCFTLTRCLLMASNPLRRVNHTTARPPMPETAPTCPHCGEDRLIEPYQRGWFCSVCARLFPAVARPS